MLSEEDKKQLKEDLENCSTLTPREKSILKYRFGFEDGEMHTLEDVAEKYYVTRERIRQIQAKAMEKIRVFKNKF